MEKTQISLTFLAFLFIGLCFGFFPFIASAATLTFSPQSGIYGAGSQVTVDVYVSSADQAMNAVSGTISFSTRHLSVASISESNSIISLWTINPTFSNSDGSVNFEGIVLNPGFTGNNGKIISITFKALSAGNATISFDSGSVLANDGLGTSIPTTLGNAQFTITGKLPTPVQSATSTPSIVLPPVIHYYPSIVHKGDALVVEGSSQYPDSKIFIWMKYNNESAQSTIITDNKYGDFTFADTNGAQIGTYQFWAQAMDEDGNLSSSSPVYNILATSPFVIVIDRFSINIFIGMSILFLLLLILILSFQGIIRKKHKTKNDMTQMILNANKLANVKFNYFNDYVNAQLDILEKDKKLKAMAGAKEVIENVREHIADYKSFIDKERK